MRILKLKIKNITSLIGSHLVDFESIQSSSSIFAITGETGSGKSSLLNSISLALFGEVYKKNTNQIDLVSLGEKDAEIELIFQVHGKYYLAEWKGKTRKNDGSFLKQPLTQRLLTEIESNDFNSPKLNLNLNTEDILKLNFDQFCKCIVLNQGEFAKFLTSHFTERKEILEKLYPGDDLDRLGKILKNDLDQNQNKLRELEIKLNEISIDPSQLGEIEKELRNLSEIINKENSKEKQLQDLSEENKTLQSSYHKIHEYLHKAEILTKDLSTQTQKINEEKLALEEEELIFSDFEKDFKSKSLNLQNLLKSEEALKIKTENIKITTDQISEKKHLANDALKKIATLRERKLENDKSLSEHRKALISAPESLDLFSKEISEYLNLCSEEEKIQIFIAQKENHLKEIESTGKEILKELEINQENFKKIPQELDELAVKIKNEKDASQEKNIKTLSLIEKKDALINEIEQLKLTLLRDKDSLLSESLSLKDMEHLASALENQLQNDLLQQSILVCLQHAVGRSLSDCPVCLNTPTQSWEDLFSRHKNIHPQEGLKVELEKIQSKIKKSEIKKDILERSISELVPNLAQKEAALSEIQDISLEKIINLKLLDERIDEISKFKWQKEQILKNIAQFESKLLDSRNIYKGIQAEHRQLLEKRENLKLHLKELSSSTRDFLPATSNKESSEILRKDLNHFFQYKTILSETEKINIEFKNQESLLDSINESILSLSKMADLLLNEISHLKNEIFEVVGKNTVSEVLRNLESDFEQKKNKLQKRKDQINEIQQIITEFESRLNSTKDLIREHETIFLKAKTQIQSISLKLKHPLFEESNLIIEKISLLNFSLKDNPDLISHFHEKTTSLYEELKTKISNMRSRMAVLNQLKVNYLEKMAKFEKFNQEKEISTKNLLKLQRLSLILGKDELRSFVLSIIEKNLIHQTNEELNQLCQGRYQIYQQFKNQKMSPEFYIVDKYKNGEKRKISTLSGGETFMVSLAMAFALAEMTRGHTEINTLFIDEGFGSLDQDSLTDVIEMLNQIQTRGLMIGIISHIKSLTDALPVNIRLNKKSNGNSEISIRYN